ncbi:PKD-like family lipoprotein [Sphingobacterium lumbrici]|uniref:PKD-like family lipoprotein n=1 Tax=Sphingobacterium lumbrici TaxID=2559600 RepID=UPI0015E40C91|nr:PKD-like family lipoprotein [Sphingobacterium lumbrici]
MDNYKYKNLNTAFVDTSTFAKQMVTRQNEIFAITPVFKSGIDPTKLTYEWRLTKVEYAPDPFTGKYLDTVLSTAQNLSVNIPFSPGPYILRLHVFDPANGNVAQIINTPLTVSSYALSGLMLLHGDANSCDVSTLVNSKVNTLLPESVDSIQRNIFSIVNGKKIEGTARSIAFKNHGANGADSKVYVFTHPNGGYRTDFGALNITDSYNTLFSVTPPANVQGYGSIGATEFLINDGGVYTQGQSNPVGFKPFGVKNFLGNSVNPSTYVATPYFAIDFDKVSANNAANAGVFYDQNARRFLAARNDNTISLFSGVAPVGGFSLSAAGKWMVYGEQGYSPSLLSPYFSRYWYCVMSDVNFTNPISAKVGTRKVYIVDLGRLPDPNFPSDMTRSLILTSNLRGIAVKDISLAQDIDDAQYFAFGNKGNIMYYATDKKVYMSNDYQTANLYYDINTNYPGNEITCMQVFKVNGHLNDGQLLYVALFDGTNSTLLQIPINGINGTIIGDVKSYTGISGKISAMNYKPF